MSKAVTHDYSEREWGRNYNIKQIHNSGMRISMSGWGTGIQSGDFIIIKNGYETTRYKFDSIEYCSDPYDMWFAEASFSPRESNA